MYQGVCAETLKRERGSGAAEKEVLKNYSMKTAVDYTKNGCQIKTRSNSFIMNHFYSIGHHETLNLNRVPK